MTRYPLVDALSTIKNADDMGKEECVISPWSKLIEGVLNIMEEKGYIGGFEKIEDGRGGKLVIELTGKINKCGAISPRFPIKRTEIEKMEKRFLPAKDFGFLILTTPKGLMTNKGIKEAGIGGKLLAYFY